MRVKFFSVPALDAVDAEAEVNRFLATHRVLSIDRQLVQDRASAYWAVCVTHLDKQTQSPPRSKIDYRQVLSEPEFALFVRLRALRKELAEKEGQPPYAVFNNEQLAAMVRQRITTLEELGKLPGIGPSRLEKYGAAFLTLLREALAPGVAGQSVAEAGAAVPVQTALPVDAGPPGTPSAGG